MAPTNRDIRKVLLWLVIVLGIILRFLPALQTDFPINDGGMFLSMIRDLRANGFVLPETTSYNQSNIPFAYPPFGFYVAAILSGIFPVSDIELLRWLPAFVSAAIVPAFYWLSLQVFGEGHKTLIATTLMALLPGSFDWLVMGGGLSRSLGIFFFLLAVGNVLGLFRDGSPRSIWTSVLFCALAVLSHPEVGLQTAGICFLLWLVYGRHRLGFQHAILVSLGTVLVTSPWWLTVLGHHGIAPFVSAMQTGIHERLAASLFHSFFSVQGGLPVLPTLTIVGLFVAIRNREYYLCGWAFLPFFLDPRNAPAITQYAYILLSSNALYFLWERFNQAYAGDIKKKNLVPSPYVPGFVLLAFVALAGYLFWVTFTASRSLARVSLKDTDRETMEWIRVNTPANGQFLLLTNTGQVNPMLDAYQEWFPALAKRHSQNTLQGREWTLGTRFYDTFLELSELQACKDVDCLQEWALTNNTPIEFVLARVERVSPQMLDALQSDGEFQLMFESDTTVIYRSMP